ncbi:MAG: metallophosphoesterase [Candidatus Latescibacteria bacterium]|nr:metallophosphoesterase [Candidatus Latescibacterota bacterium]
MGSGTFKLPTGEYRFTSEQLSIAGDQKVCIAPSIWCIHGEYEAFGKYIVTKSNVTAHLAQIHPFTLGWIADLHFRSDRAEVVREQIDRLSLCNPALTVFGGDIVSGSGEYSGSDMDDSWFGAVWDYAKDRLSNHLWVKGNHDIDPNSYFYYNWFERLWTLRMGRFKFIGFDGYNEQVLCPGSCHPCLSLPDILWLARRMREDDLEKVILVHQPLDQWCIYCPKIFKETKEKVVCVYSGHSHDVIYMKSPYKEILGIPNYVNGSCSEEVKLQVATLTIFTKDGKEQTVLVDGGMRVDETPDGFEITAPGTVSWEKERVVSTVPIRLVRRIGEHNLNLIALLRSETKGSVCIRKVGRDMQISGDMEIVALGKGLCSEEPPYDSWICSCGAVWNSYRIASGNTLRCDFEEKR